MNKEWSEKNQTVQNLLKKDTFAAGISELLELRKILMQEILSWKELTKEDFCAIPFLNAKGYHSKTIAYSLWHPVIIKRMGFTWRKRKGRIL